MYRHIRAEELVDMREPALAIVQVIGVHGEAGRRRTNWSIILGEALMRQRI